MSSNELHFDEIKIRCNLIDNRGYSLNLEFACKGLNLVSLDTQTMVTNDVIGITGIEGIIRLIPSLAIVMSNKDIT